MRKLRLLQTCLLVGILFFNVVGVVAQNCNQTIPDESFQRGLGRVAAQPDNQRKLDRALEMTRFGCLTSAQVKSVANVFTDDSFRYQYAKAVYAYTKDKENFFDVYDAFRSISYAIRLYDYTLNPNSQTARVVPFQDRPKYEQPRQQVIVEVPQVTFANLAYPSANNYYGNKGCPGPVSDPNTFMTAAGMVKDQPSDESKYIAIQQRAQDFCFSMEQIMKLTSLINSEKLRLRTLNETLPKIYDQDHFMSARALFTTNDLQTQWVNAAQFYLTPAPPPPPACVVSDSEMGSVLNAIRARNFPAEKLELIDIFNKDKCFSVAQINTITKEFPFDKDKLEAIKKLYGKCTDQSNYYKLSDALTFGFVKDDFNQWLKGK